MSAGAEFVIPLTGCADSPWCPLQSDGQPKLPIPKGFILAPQHLPYPSQTHELV